MPGGLELLVFVDDERSATIHESVVIDETNFAHLVTAPGEPTAKFPAQVAFPSHGLIVRPNADDTCDGIVKGIVDLHSLDTAIAAAAALSRDGCARAGGWTTLVCHLPSQNAAPRRAVLWRRRSRRRRSGHVIDCEHRSNTCADPVIPAPVPAEKVPVSEVQIPDPVRNVPCSASREFGS